MQQWRVKMTNKPAPSAESIAKEAAREIKESLGLCEDERDYITEPIQSAISRAVEEAVEREREVTRTFKEDNIKLYAECEAAEERERALLETAKHDAMVIADLNKLVLSMRDLERREAEFLTRRVSEGAR